MQNCKILVQIFLWWSLCIGGVSLCTLASAREDISKHSPAVQSLYRSAGAKYEAHDSQGAIRDYNAAIELEPKFAGLYYLRACNKHILKDYEGALADCSKSIELDPTGNGIAYFQRAMAEFRLKRPDDCIRDCNMALKIAPDFKPTYIYRAHAEDEKGDKKAALQDCEIYLRAFPTEERALKFRARLMSR